jgi:hypothetical protein
MIESDLLNQAMTFIGMFKAENVAQQMNASDLIRAIQAQVNPQLQAQQAQAAAPAAPVAESAPSSPDNAAPATDATPAAAPVTQDQQA